MEKLSQKTVDLLNIISNARYHKGIEYDDTCLTKEQRQTAFLEYLALSEVEDKMYDAAGISYEEFLGNRYRKFND